jgi:hypothetical protein
MLNSPAKSGAAAADAFFMNVMRRMRESSESRKAVKELAHVSASNQEVQDYEKIVREMNLRLAELFYAGDLTAISEQFGFPMATLQALYHKAGSGLFCKRI